MYVCVCFLFLFCFCLFSFQKGGKDLGGMGRRENDQNILYEKNSIKKLVLNGHKFSLQNEVFLGRMAVGVPLNAIEL